ncbi:MAG TPA: putative O-glycosylation ligase, exosortase A system-associated [Bryobacteraceae bacterium]
MGFTDARDYILTLFFFGLMFYSYRRPWAAVLVWAWLGFMNPHRLCWGFARYLIPFSAIAALVTFLAMFISNQKNKFPWTRETILLAIFCVWMCITTVFAFNQDEAGKYLDRSLKIQAMIFCIFWILQSRFHLEALVWVIVFSFGFYGVKGGLFTLMTGGGGQVMGPAGSFITGNNEIALALVMILPLMGYLLMHSERRSIKWAMIVSQILTVVAVIGTYSRAGFLALCVLLAFQWWASRYKVALTLALMLLGPPIFFFMPQQWRDRMSTIRNTSEGTMDASAKGRINAWRMGLNLAEHRPITGGGFRTFTTEAFRQYAPDPADQHDAHSIYIEVLAEQGFPGLAMFLTLALFTWMSGRRVKKIARVLPEMQWAADMVVQTELGLAAYAVAGAFAGLAYFDLPYAMMAMIVLCRFLADRALRERTWEHAHAETAIHGLVPQEA